jgi:hypothetical protein
MVLHTQRKKIANMSAINIGIQVIMPKTGTSHEPPQPTNSHARNIDSAWSKPSSPPPGHGGLVDKTA